MKKYLAIVFAITLFIVEVGSFLWVLHANLALKDDLALLAGTDALVVPNSQLVPSLDNIVPAFWGSLFITFTGGLVISVIICFLALICIKLFKRFRQKTGLGNPIRSLAVRLAVPGIFLAGTFMILIAFTDQSIFHRTRDYLLLSNPLGIAVSKVYYTYSPYAVNAVQPPIEKLVKTVWRSPNVGDTAVLKPILSKFGWFQVKSMDATSFVIRRTEQNHLAFLAKDKTILTVAAADFIDDPARYLKQYSQNTDSARFIRGLCAAGLLMGMPACLFLSIYFSYAAVFSLIIPVTPARFFSGVLLLATAVGLTIFLYPNHPTNLNAIQAMLSSRHVKQRIEAMRLLSGRGVSINDIQGTLGEKMHSPSIAERYWVAKLLAHSKAPQSVHMLKQMLDDPEIIVAAAAIKSLYRRSADRQTIALFKKIAQTRPEWYVQITAYNAVTAYHGR